MLLIRNGLILLLRDQPDELRCRSTRSAPRARRRGGVSVPEQASVKVRAELRNLPAGRVARTCAAYSLPPSGNPNAIRSLGESHTPEGSRGESHTPEGSRRSLLSQSFPFSQAATL